MCSTDNSTHNSTDTKLHKNMDKSTRTDSFGGKGTGDTLDHADVFARRVLRDGVHHHDGLYHKKFLCWDPLGLVALDNHTW